MARGGRVPECPFCRAGVEEDLVLYGGSCPHCFNSIPGEEAPTDPGVPAKEDGKAAASAGGGGNKILTAAAVVLLATGGAFGALKSQEDAQPGAGGDEPLNGFFDASLDPEAQAKAMADAFAENSPPEAVEAEQASVVSMPKASQKQRSAKSYPASDNHASRGGTQVAEEPATLSSGGPVVIPRRLRLEPDALSDPDKIAEAITHTLRANNGRFTQCYNQRLKEYEGLRGSWMVSFTVMPNGSTSEIRVRALTVRDKMLEECLGRQVGDLRFPKIEQASAFARKYHFGSG